MAGNLVTETREACAGNEGVIVAALGLDAGIMRGKHGPCPACGGTDRFRLDLRRKKPKWFCNRCAPKGADMIDLVQAIEGLADATAAALRAREILGLPTRANGAQSPAEREQQQNRLAELRKRAADETARREKLEAEETADQLRKARFVWTNRSPMGKSIAAVYWQQARKLGNLPGANIEFLRGNEKNPPAMVSAFARLDEEGFPMVDSLDNVDGVHITRLAKDGRGKAGTAEDKIIIGRGHSWPIVVSMGADDNETLVIAEGIEDAATAAVDGSFAAWAAGVANRLEGLAQHVPAWVREVIIIEDDDGAGRNGARRLAVALKAKGLSVRIERGGEKIDGPKCSKREDLNACLQEKGPDAVKKRLALAVPFTTNEQGITSDEAADVSKHDEASRGVNAMTDNNEKFQAGKQKPEKKGRAKLHLVTDADQTSTDSRPVISLRAGDLDRIVQEAEQELVEAGVQMYRRGDNIVRPVMDAVPASDDRVTKTPRLISVAPDYMRLALSRYLRWEKFDARARGMVPCDPPKEIAAGINARAGEWTFPPVFGISGTQTIRSDGSLVLKPGYDTRTGIILFDPPELPDMPDVPTKYDAESALALLRELLVDFPFVDSASESVALSAIITPVVRPSLETAPMHVSTAPTPGSGKSYVFDVASTVATGDICPVIPPGENEAEMGKSVGAAIMAGWPIISIDNVDADLGGATLCQAVERPIVRPRILGKSEHGNVPNRATFFATGNNIRLVGDMSRRTILCSLDAKMERPEMRNLPVKPHQTVMADRGAYVAACLTIVRAYILAGRPGRLSPLQSFEKWSDNVRSALVWLGCADPVGTMEVVRDRDPLRAGHVAFLEAWRSEIGLGPSNRHTSAELAKLITEGQSGVWRAPLMREAIFNSIPERQFNTKKLGNWLMAHSDKIANRMSLQKVPDSVHGHSWFVEAAEPAG